jgi:RNA polymerase sigma-70 factor, ECF subfamily
MTMDSPVAPSAGRTGPAALADCDLITRILAGERWLFEILMRRHNQRLYRTARAIIQDEVEVEDILQQAYLNAFAHLAQFEARSRLSTWLTRIVINEASARRRHLTRAPLNSRAADRAGQAQTLAAVASVQPSPEHQAYASELQRLLEAAVDGLPEAYRLVFMLREVEGLSTAETAVALGLGDEVVKTRLHRSRAMIRRFLTGRFGEAAAGTFQFLAPRCDRVAAAVLDRIYAGIA